MSSLKDSACVAGLLFSASKGGTEKRAENAEETP